MSHVKIWVHTVWTTKYREKILIPRIRYNVFRHIKDVAREKDIIIDFINGFSDHVHALILLGKDQTIAEVVHSIKGESSHWINENKLIHKKFVWQDDYYTISISPSDVQNVRNYIRNQENHHLGISWDDEIRSFTQDNGFENIKDYK